MKRLIIFLFFIFLLTSCQIEMSDYELVSGIAIDKINDKYIIKIEALNPKTDELIYIESESSSLNECILKIQDKSAKRAYFNYARVIILGEEYVNDGIDNLIDFILLNGYRLNIPIVISKGNATDVLKKNDKYGIVGNGIYKNLEGNKDFGGSFNIIKFYELYNDLLFNNSYSCIPVCFNDEGDISVSGGVIMDNYKLGIYIDKEDVDLINIINNNYKDNKIFINGMEIATNNIKANININEKITIKINNKEIIPYIKEEVIKMLNSNIDPFDFDKLIYHKSIKKYDDIKIDYINKIKKYEVDVIYER